MLDTQLMDWLNQQPQDKNYDYCSQSHCAAAQFNKSVNREYNVGKALMDANESIPERHRSFDGRMERAAKGQPWTFGDMKKRLLEPV